MKCLFPCWLSCLLASGLMNCCSGRFWTCQIPVAFSFGLLFFLFVFFWMGFHTPISKGGGGISLRSSSCLAFSSSFFSFSNCRCSSSNFFQCGLSGLPNRRDVGQSRSKVSLGARGGFPSNPLPSRGGPKFANFLSINCKLGSDDTQQNRFSIRYSLLNFSEPLNFHSSLSLLRLSYTFSKTGTPKGQLLFTLALEVYTHRVL